jgi:hypothetical protein
MAGAVDTLETSILNHFLNKATWSAPASLYMGCYTTVPNDAGVGGIEVSGGSYARQLINGSMATGVNGVSTNTLAVPFPQASANWGTILGLGFWSASTAGTLYAFTLLDVARTIGSGDILNFPIGAITMQVD